MTHALGRSVRSILGPLVLLIASTRVAAQESGTTARADSVTVRFVDSELRIVVQALGQYLELPLVLASMPVGRVTLETPRPVAREAVLPLLRGLLESQRLRLIRDTTAGLYRIEAMPAEASPLPHAEQPGSAATDLLTRPPLQLYTLRLRHARAADVAATVNTL